MKLSKNNLLTVLALVLVGFAACKPEDDKPATSYGSGVFITNEGAFNGGTGTVSFYNRTVGSGGKDDIYGAVNAGAKIGNILQSMTVHLGIGYLVVNNANKMIAVDPSSFAFASSADTGLSLPRNFLGLDAKRAYITEWGKDGVSGGIAIYDLATKTVASHFSTGGKGADRMLQVSTNRIWVAHSGGFGQDSTIAIVDATGDSVLTKIQVGLAPNSLVADANGDIWVLCGGYYNRSGGGKLLKIRGNAIEKSFEVPKNASSLISDATKSTLYFVADGKVYTKDILNFGANAPSVFLTNSAFGALNGLGIDPKTGYLYVADAKDYASKGKVYIYDTSKKSAVDSLSAGIVPNGFYFQSY